MKKLQTTLLLALILCSTIAFAQPTFPINGVQDNREGVYAFTNATVHTTYNKTVENATLLIKDGKVEAVGAGVRIPKNAVVVDTKGKHIYPSFIDLYATYGVPKVEGKSWNWGDPPKFISSKEGAYAWNETIKAEFDAVEHFKVDKKAAKAYIKLGFGAVLSHQQSGIVRGSGVFVLLNEENEHEVILKEKASAHYSFKKGASSQVYPTSLMGGISLLRQTYLDAKWHAQTGKKEEKNITLQSFNELQNLPQIFEVRDWLSALRADKVGDEFGVQYIVKGDGDEYQRINELKSANIRFIIPLNFPDAYDVEDPFDAANVSLKEMKHWELAPSNPSMLDKANIDFAFTLQGLKNKKDFLKNIREAIKRGLSEEAALKALTHNPASLLGMNREIGSLEKGKVANFLITSDNIFEKKAEINENWVGGKPYRFKELHKMDLKGEYAFNVGKVNYALEVDGEPDAPKINIILNDSTKISVKHTIRDENISLSFDTNKDSLNQSKLGEGKVRLSGWINKEGEQWLGRGQDADGQWLDWQVLYAGELSDKEEEAAKDEIKELEEEANEDLQAEAEVEGVGEILYPFEAYGSTTTPQKEAVLFKNVTVWTNESQGILEKADVLIENGKIAAVGENVPSSTAKVIDAEGKHLTCGIIDEHSHIAISKGVNEGGQASSAEVRIGDVVNSEDVNIYRQLAGGVTTSQLLHGSANPIGGQSAIVKLRWGYLPEAMKMEGAPGFIKFALGENVKQSSWSHSAAIRFPQSRMGVEQVYVDGFTRAREYGKQRGGIGSLPKGKKQRTPVLGNMNVKPDLELDALLEILEGKRFITCHSYVQSEITMLMRVAEQFGFKINTFTHILEGYKVSDKMKAHGANASTFSDWWAYKYEVIDAIPFNGAIMHKMGINVAFNSDDAEMARRLNQEAAKAVKYGGLSEEEAWKFVTLNPAKMLRIDNRVGSIKVGKDADVVLWSDNPLSIYAKAEKTFVDGICFFDREENDQKEEYIRRERNRLVQKMLNVKRNGGKTQAAKPKKKRLYHCDDMGEGEITDFYHEHHKGH
ncbi:MAG: amidohydrolase family protein [Chitinophagales bacterium]